MEHSAIEAKNKFTIKKINILFIGPILVILVGCYLYLTTGRYISTDDSYLKAMISPVAAQVKGIVDQVNIKDNSKVNQGDIIFTIDKKPYSIALASADAHVNSTINSLNAEKAAYYVIQAQVDGAMTDVNFYQKQYDRTKTLASDKTSSQATLDGAKHQLDVATQNLNQLNYKLKQQLAILGNDINAPIENHPDYLQAKGIYETIKLDLGYTDVAAPFTGVLSRLNLAKGAPISIGTPLFNLVDNNYLWIEANFKETDLTNVKVGQNAIIKIDTYPDKKFKATVASITAASGSEFSLLPAENSSGNWVKVTQRVMVRLEFTDYDKKLTLVSGMSANVMIDTKSP
jgi:membrane fusion protein (multidrug efflux system)